MDRLQDKVVFITGASAGIGRASGVLFAKEGAKVAVADIDEPGGQETVRLITQGGGEAKFIRTDVTNLESVKQAIQITIDHFGKLDVLYNNAGGSRPDDGPVTEIPVEVWQKTHAVDLFGTFLCCKLGIPELIKNGGGSVILTASMAGLRGWQRSAYTAAKGGIISLTRVMAVDYAKYRIRVNCLCPGLTMNERVAKRMKASSRTVEGLRPLHLLGLGEAIDVAYAALYFASDESRIVTGAILPVDSGYTVVGRINTSDLLEKK